MFDWKIFDRIYCIHYLPYTDRMTESKKVFDRLGISSSGRLEWFYTSNNKFFNSLYLQMLKSGMIFSETEQEATLKNHEGYIKNERVFNLAINEYNMLTQAYMLGYKRILVLEDDLTFMKDWNLLERYLKNYPLDYDIVSMEYWFRNQNDTNTAFSHNRRINDYFYFLSRERLVNFSCVGLSRKGIKHILDGMNQKFICSDYYIANQDTYDDWRIKRAVSRVPICVQKINSNSNHTAEFADMKWKYDKIGLDLSNYEGY